jgi:hypothetical protein
MKKNLLNIYIFTFVFLSDFVMFAQEPGDEDDNGDLEGGDELPVPINGKLLWLAILGILFALYVYRRDRKEA